ncbi:MAG: phospholipase [Actinomycetota bacterium]|nr:phospholipase [Actinomycetota bacterium]
MSGHNGPMEGRLRARPVQEVSTAAPVGLQSLGVGVARGDYLLHVPETYRTASPAPLMLWLHGAGGRARDFPSPEQPGQAAGMLLLVPTSKEYTWDVIVGRGRYGPDVAVIDRALESTFGRYAVDPTRIAAGGFSDGASYALSLGITNGDLFTHVLAFSPGFMMPAGQRGSPCIFVSHGTHDEVLPIDRCSRRIVPQLRRAGYDVSYREFEGGHAVPSDVTREAVGWFAAEQGA